VTSLRLQAAQAPSAGRTQWILWAVLLGKRATLKAEHFWLGFALVCVMELHSSLEPTKSKLQSRGEVRFFLWNPLKVNAVLLEPTFSTLNPNAKNATPQKHTSSPLKERIKTPLK